MSGLMDEYDYQRLINDPNTFHPEGCAYTFEAWKYAVSFCHYRLFKENVNKIIQDSHLNTFKRDRISVSQVQSWGPNVSV
jgi:hypothetical protein